MLLPHLWSGSLKVHKSRSIALINLVQVCTISQRFGCEGTLVDFQRDCNLHREIRGWLREGHQFLTGHPQNFHRVLWRCGHDCQLGSGSSFSLEFPHLRCWPLLHSSLGISLGPNPVLLCKGMLCRLHYVPHLITRPLHRTSAWDANSHWPCSLSWDCIHQPFSLGPAFRC